MHPERIDGSPRESGRVQSAAQQRYSRERYEVRLNATERTGQTGQVAPRSAGPQPQNQSFQATQTARSAKPHVKQSRKANQPPRQKSVRRSKDAEAQVDEYGFVQHKPRRMRWEMKFVAGVVVALAVIVGAGGFVAAKKTEAAMNYQTFSSEVAAAASSEAPTDAQSAAAQSQGNASGQDAKSASAATDAAALAARDASFAVDPNNTAWNFEQSDRKVVYLTLDDGPSENTQAILDILDRYNCKATFFVVGHNSDYFPQIAEAYRRGHTIGMHTFTHDYEWVYSSDDAYFQDLEQICDVVKEQIGYVPCFIRFPGGSSNDISANYNEGIMSRLAEEVQARGFQYFDWSRSFGDGDDHTAEELIGYACEPTDDTNIVMLCHDSGTKQTTVEALPAIIEHYQGLGYTFEALSRDSWVPHHEIAN